MVVFFDSRKKKNNYISSITFNSYVLQEPLNGSKKTTIAIPSVYPRTGWTADQNEGRLRKVATHREILKQINKIQVPRFY